MKYGVLLTSLGATFVILSIVMINFSIGENMETEKYLCEDNLGGENLAGIMCERETLNQEGSILRLIFSFILLFGVLLILLGVQSE